MDPPASTRAWDRLSREQQERITRRVERRLQKQFESKKPFEDYIAVLYGFHLALQKIYNEELDHRDLDRWESEGGKPEGQG